MNVWTAIQRLFQEQTDSVALLDTTMSSQTVALCPALHTAPRRSSPVWCALADHSHMHWLHIHVVVVLPCLV